MPYRHRADASKQQAQRIQSAIAGCMKQQGVKYAAWVPEQNVFEELDKASSGDYEAMRKERSSQYLGREIKAAPDDLECGRDFYAAYLPRKRAISVQVGELFGGGGIR